MSGSWYAISVNMKPVDKITAWKSWTIKLTLIIEYHSYSSHSVAFHVQFLSRVITYRAPPTATTGLISSYFWYRHSVRAMAQFNRYRLTDFRYNYLRRGGCVIVAVSVCVCMCVRKIMTGFGDVDQSIRFWWWSGFFRGSRILFQDSLPLSYRA